ncbi:hypothetical protein QSV34_12990 [Porticoccus sp. W117]|uniref:hypothetical protein n=1 Tax=Porticoccus sp. W117 TaxID=3054777 RepID=UPI00259A3680|nr:hypothetical protein [Porticoccus sp. W117]MDM3872264.1 hypothetical protein [Porticoccus sp. W117]
MIEEVDIEVWGDFEESESDSQKVLIFPDSSTINRPVNVPVDLSRALQVTAQWLFMNGYGVVAAKRNDNNTAWLALCDSS